MRILIYFLLFGLAKYVWFQLNQYQCHNVNLSCFLTQESLILVLVCYLAIESKVVKINKVLFYFSILKLSYPYHS